jgi:hypothetical protein
VTPIHLHFLLSVLHFSFFLLRAFCASAWNSLEMYLVVTAAWFCACCGTGIPLVVSGTAASETALSADAQSSQHKSDAKAKSRLERLDELLRDIETATG